MSTVQSKHTTNTKLYACFWTEYFDGSKALTHFSSVIGQVRKTIYPGPSIGIKPTVYNCTLVNGTPKHQPCFKFCVTQWPLKVVCWYIMCSFISVASFYKPDGPFLCLDGSKTIPFEYVNDDYCDCPDGSDEPGDKSSILSIYLFRSMKIYKL